MQRPDGPAGDPVWIDDVLIVVTELVQNVSQHTDADGELLITATANTVVVEVGDTSTVIPSARHPAADQIGGRGLSLVQALSQAWGVRTCPHGKAVWAQLSAITDPSLSAA